MPLVDKDDMAFLTSSDARASGRIVTKHFALSLRFVIDWRKLGPFKWKWEGPLAELSIG